MIKSLVSYAVLLSACFPLCAADADLILQNGKIVTVDNTFSMAQALAIRAGRITKVGTNADVLASERGPQTRVTDLHGQTVLPGLIDCHVHPLSAALSEYRGAIPPLHSFADIQNYIRAKAKTTPKGEWIVVPRTFPTRLLEMRMPTRDVLDVDADHPVLFDASYVWVLNSTALKMNRIDAKTPNPPGGQIVHDANGEPNGILRNAESLVKGVQLSGAFTPEEKIDALEKMLKRYLGAGITTIQDRAVTAEEVGYYEFLKSRGRLPIRTVLTWRPNAQRPVEEILSDIRNSPWVTGRGDEWLKFGTFKVTLDGGMTIGTAYQRAPYGEFGKQLYGLSDPGDRGQLFIAPDKLYAIMKAARDQGWQLTAHSQGGGAVDALLDAFEKLDRERPLRPTRSHVMHASFQSPESIARAAKMGVLADVQPDWLYFDGTALQKVFGVDGMRYFIPLRSYREAGVIIAGGSDHMIGFDKNTAVNAYNPFLGMWIAIARKTMQGEVIHPEERITREEALKMYTIWPAYLQFNERDRGSIETGKLADLVVIDRDYRSCPENEIRAIEPVMTILNGRVVYSH